VDDRNQFCGYTVPSCNSRVVARPGCSHNSNGSIDNFALDQTSFRRSPRGSGRCGTDRVLCLPESHYDYVVCAVAQVLDAAPSPPTAQ
jgi:hypothetical protein